MSSELPAAGVENHRRAETAAATARRGGRGRVVLDGILLAGTFVVTFGLAYLLATTHADLSMLLNTFTGVFLSLFIEAAPFLLLGALISGAIDVFVRPEQIAAGAA